VIRIVVRTHGGPVLRAAVFLALALSVAGTMLAIVPVAAYYAAAQYAYADFDDEVDGLFSAADLQRLRAQSSDAGLASFIVVSGSVSSDPPPPGTGRKGTAATVLFADLGSDLSASWFTDATTVDSAEVGDDWADLSATLALRLGVAAGDPVSIPLTSGHITGRVRRVLALDFNGRPVAVAPRSSAVDRLLPDQAGLSTLVTLRSAQSPAAIARTAVSVPASAGAKTVEPVVRTRADAAATAAVTGGVQGDGLRTFTSLGVLLLVGLAIREGHALVTRRADALAITVAVGARRRSVLLALLTLEVVAATTVGIAAWWAIRAVGFGSIFPDAWPPRLDGVLALGLLAALTSYVLAVLVVGLRSFSYERLLATVREGRSL